MPIAIIRRPEVTYEVLNKHVCDIQSLQLGKVFNKSFTDWAALEETRVCSNSFVDNIY